MALKRYPYYRGPVYKRLWENFDGAPISTTCKNFGKNGANRPPVFNTINSDIK